MGRHAKSVAVVLVVMAGTVGCARYTAEPEASLLYDRLGGKPAITAVVGDFLQAVGQDSRVRHQPVPERVPALQVSLVDLVCQASGGPCEYRGRPMKAAHAGMGISQVEFEAVVDDLVKTLDRYKVPAREKNDLLGLLAPSHNDVVEVQ